MEVKLYVWPQIDGIHCGNPQALQQYKEWRRRIEQLRQDVADRQTSLETRTAATEAKKVQQLKLPPGAMPGQSN